MKENQNRKLQRNKLVAFALAALIAIGTLGVNASAAVPSQNARALTYDDFISEICYACGFNNISNFNRFFKKKIGMTPSEYRVHIKTSMMK